MAAQVQKQRQTVKSIGEVVREQQEAAEHEETLRKARRAAQRARRSSTTARQLLDEIAYVLES